MQRQLFAVIRRRGAAWRHGLPLVAQPEWDAHARFMDALFEDGFVVLGGPLEDRSEALLIIRAQSIKEIEERLSTDPWYKLDLLRPGWIAAWTLRLGSLS